MTNDEIKVNEMDFLLFLIKLLFFQEQNLFKYHRNKSFASVKQFGEEKHFKQLL